MKKLSQILQLHSELTKGVDQFNYEKYHANSLDITRDQMPQIYTEHFEDVLSALKARFGYVVKSLPLCELNATQNEVNKDKIKSKLLSPGFRTSDLKFIVSETYHIADGHHSHVAGLCLDKKAPARVYVINTDTKTLIDTLNSFHVTDNKSINESKC